MKCYIAIYTRIPEDLGYLNERRDTYSMKIYIYIYIRVLYIIYMFKLELLNLIGSNTSPREREKLCEFSAYPSLGYPKYVAKVREEIIRSTRADIV